LDGLFFLCHDAESTHALGAAVGESVAAAAQSPPVIVSRRGKRFSMVTTSSRVAMLTEPADSSAGSAEPLMDSRPASRSKASSPPMVLRLAKKPSRLGMFTSRSTCDARPSVDARPEPGAAARERVDFAQQGQRGHRRQRRHRRDGERARDVLEGAEARDGRDVRVVDELDARRSVDGLELVEARDRLQPRALRDDEVAADVHELVEAVQVLEHGVAVEDQVALDGADGRDGRRVEVRRRLARNICSGGHDPGRGAAALGRRVAFVSDAAVARR